MQSIPILSLTRPASATVEAHRFITPAGAHPSADGNALGVTRFGGVSGDPLTVDIVGTTIVEAGAAISEGATLKVGTAGKAIAWATSGARVGIALEAADADGDLIEILLIPNAA